MSQDVVASIRAKLLNAAKKTGEEFELTLVRFMVERLLYRLGMSEAREHCLLKGASLLAVWLPDPYRATRDVDLLHSGNVSDTSIRAMLESICAVRCPEDGLHFDLSGLIIETIRAEEEYSGKRARFRAYLGSARIAVQLDIGVGDAVAIEAQEIIYPTILPGLPAPRLRAYPREVAVAEKFEAMIKLGTRNSRMKDFHDIWALAGAFEFDGATLQRAVAACFEHRSTPWAKEMPGVLTPAFYQNPEIATRWRNYLAAGAVLVPPPTQFEVIGERVIQFLGPVRQVIISGETLEQPWPPGGPWGAKHNVAVQNGVAE